MRTIAISLLILAGGAAAVAAQPAPAPLQFEVASVKATGPIDTQKLLSGQQRMGMRKDAGRVDIEGVSLSDLLTQAFKVTADQVNGPSWLTSGSILTAERFAIHAKLPAGATEEQIPEMLQGLLAERFKLAFHREKKDQSVYALIIGRNGSKLQAAAPDPVPSPDAPAAGGSARPDGVQISGNPQNGGSITIRGAAGAGSGATKMSMGPDGTMHLEAEKMTMLQLAQAVARFVDKPIVDMTGLQGAYKIVLDLSTEDLLAAARASGLQIPAGALGGAPGGGPADPGNGSTIFKSIEQLGLKLDARKAPVDYLVIDRLEKTPTED